MIIKQYLKVLQNVIIIFNAAYFVGFLWMIICQVSKELHLEEGIFHDTANFLDVNEFHKYTQGEQAIKVCYFAFTSLSTVGFGDYHPESSIERVCGAFILMLGVAIFSGFIGTFIDVVNELG